jgi:hypothetical protein
LTLHSPRGKLMVFSYTSRDACPSKHFGGVWWCTEYFVPKNQSPPASICSVLQVMTLQFKSARVLALWALGSASGSH